MGGHRCVAHYDSINIKDSQTAPLLDALAKALDNASAGKVPAAWKPCESTMKRLNEFRKNAKASGSWVVQTPALQPNQTDDNSCGVFMLATASRVVRGIGLDYGQDHSLYYRMAIAAVVCKLPSPAAF